MHVQMCRVTATKISPNIALFIQMPIEAAHLYDAVMIYARAATELLAEGEDPRNGSAILGKIRNRSYHSLQGYDVRLTVDIL